MADLISTDRTIRALQRQSLFVISADRGWVQRFQLAAQDVQEGFMLWRLSWALRMSDIRLRYCGSALEIFVLADTSFNSHNDRCDRLFIC